MRLERRMEENHSTKQTSNASEYDQRIRVVRKWLFVLAKTFQFELPEDQVGAPSFMEVWTMALLSISLPELDRAFLQVLETWRPEYGRKFPVPGDVRHILDAEALVAATDEAEQAWKKFLRIIDSHFHPDVGWRDESHKNLVLSDPHMRAAAECAGGVFAVWNMKESERLWAKRRFVEEYVKRQTIESRLPAAPLPALPGK